MELNQNPFSLYDFLGYFIPGAIFIYGAIAIYAHSQPNLYWPLIRQDKFLASYLLFLLRNTLNGLVGIHQNI